MKRSRLSSVDAQQNVPKPITDLPYAGQLSPATVQHLLYCIADLGRSILGGLVWQSAGEGRNAEICHGAPDTGGP